MLSPRAHIDRPNAAPMHDVAAIISRFTRPQIEGFVDLAICLLDALDGDADSEDDDPHEDDDPYGGNVDDEPHDHDWEAEHKLQPESGIDQTDELKN